MPQTTPARHSAMPRRRIGYRLSLDEDPPILWAYEDPGLVLLGGEVWPSAYAMSAFVQSFLGTWPPLSSSSSSSSPLTVVELGAGAGLCGLVAAAAAAAAAAADADHQRPCEVFLTDESPELAEVNAEHFRGSWRCVGQAPVTVQALELSWGDEHELPPAVQESLHRADDGGALLVLGCEVTPMAKTQPALVQTLRALLSLGSAPSSSSTAILTVDACTLVANSPDSPPAYPATCPQGGKPCAGHQFLALAASQGLRWRAESVLTAAQVRATYRSRRVVATEEGGGGGGQESEDFELSVTAPEGLVIVSLTLVGSDGRK